MAEIRNTGPWIPTHVVGQKHRASPAKKSKRKAAQQARRRNR
jgi:hypothetical protein